MCRGCEAIYVPLTTVQSGMDTQKCAELHSSLSRGGTKFFTEGSVFYYVPLLNQLMRLYRILSWDGGAHTEKDTCLFSFWSPSRSHVLVDGWLSGPQFKPSYHSSVFPPVYLWLSNKGQRTILSRRTRTRSRLLSMATQSFVFNLVHQNFHECVCRKRKNILRTAQLDTM